MISQKIKLSPHGNFQITKFLETVAICEAIEDRYNWGNATEDKPAFILNPFPKSHFKIPEIRNQREKAFNLV